MLGLNPSWHLLSVFSLERLCLIWNSGRKGCSGVGPFYFINVDSHVLGTVWAGASQGKLMSGLCYSQLIGALHMVPEDPLVGPCEWWLAEHRASVLACQAL